MKKKNALLLMLLSTMFLAVGCGNTVEEPKEENPSSEKEGEQEGEKDKDPEVEYCRVLVGQAETFTNLKMYSDDACTQEITNNKVEKGKSVVFTFELIGENTEIVSVTYDTASSTTQTPINPVAGATGIKYKIDAVNENITIRITTQTHQHSWGDWTETKAASHAEKGSEKRTCSTCSAEETRDIEKLSGHTWGEATTVAADHDLAEQKYYSCAADNCKKIEWSAKEVSPDTKAGSEYIPTGATEAEPNYVVSGDGVQFYGRPKGNAGDMKLSSKPSEFTFDANVKGSYLEYNINTAVRMQGVKLVADLDPAQYLDSTGGLFVSASGDCTPGLVADGESYKATDFRYDVYVNKSLVTLDASKNIAGNAVNGRGWYEFPCTFDLVKGVNTIKIVMAGGWKHTFYNFRIESTEAVSESIIPAASEGFEVSFAQLPEHVTGVTVYEDQACTIADTGAKHYSRNPVGRKLDDGEGQINFAIEVESGYQVKAVSVPYTGEKPYNNIKTPNDTSADTELDNVYRITKIAKNITVEITVEESTATYDGNKVTFDISDPHITKVEIYESKEYNPETLVAGSVAFVLDETTMKPTFNEGQVYFKLFFEDGYELDTYTKGVEGTTYKNLKLPADTKVANGYRLTKVVGTFTIVFTAKASA